MDGSPNYVAPQHYMPGPAGSPPPPRQRGLVVAAAVMSAAALIGAVAAVFIAGSARKDVSPPAASSTSPSGSATVESFIFNKESDKQWCRTMRPLLAETIDMMPSAVIDHGPTGAEFQRYSSWVNGWADRTKGSLDTLVRAQGSGWLDRAGRRMIDRTVAVNLVVHDEFWTADARYIFNDSAEVGNPINGYCRQLGEPVVP
ncbi:Uncharacterised protein [Mycobacteroides abscessus subsp. abscessus]|nr:hypothetical protein [Mycobacteroides abscessus]SHR21552.1 Uncharacterised protein [Mycobacteroides abscessus subsp. abscessus]MBE5428437.1 hypothetical protein [Mycobacteroides abscessus]MBE5477998.1 hypothetical protein [Mycobacteroides abscessus]SHZ71594.1 Uncharacterised protein [Mycobacteroides abscessus subsp. abscessus]